MSDHTPTTAEVKAAAESDSPYGYLEPGQFDRWLAAHAAQVRREAKAEALKDLADNHTTRIPDILGYKVQAVFTETIWEKLDELEENK